MFHKKLIKEFKDLMKNVWRMVISQWTMLVANIALMLVLSEYVSGILSGEGGLGRTVFLLLVFILTAVLRSIMSFWGSRLTFETSKIVKSHLRSRIYEKLMNVGNNYKDSFQTSEIVQVSTEGVEQLEIYFGKYVPQFFYSVLAPVTLFFVTGTMSLKIALVLLSCVPLIPLSIVAVQKFAKKMLARYWGTYTEMGDSFLECLQGLSTLKIYQADERYAKKIDEEAEKFRKVTMRVLVMQLNSISVMDLAAYGGTAAGIILSVLEYQKGSISLAQCFFIIVISAEFFLPLRLLGSFFHIAMNGNAAADKIFRLLDLPEKADKGQKYSERMGKSAGTAPDFPVVFQHVEFSYEKEKQVLSGISLRAGQGLTGLAGESGCGKSTIAALLMGDMAPDAGQVLVDGISVEEEDQRELRKKVTRIRHDSYLLAGTVREHLQMGRETASDEEMWDVLEQVNMKEILQKKGGLDFVMQEKASNLSGGQRQRLALARALLHDSDIYLFDEATSNVDAESENDIMKVIRKLARRKTVILISHRLSNLEKADRIYVMKDGKMIEEGSHSRLCAEGGFYARLYHRQRELEEYGRKAVSEPVEEGSKFRREEMEHEQKCG